MSTIERDTDLKTLYKAINTSRTNEAKGLIQKLYATYNPDIDMIHEKDDNTYLVVACKRGNNILVETLLNANADPNKPNARNHSPLNVCCEMRDLDIFYLLLQNGATIDEKSFAFAIKNANKEMIEHFLFLNMDVNVRCPRPYGNPKYTKTALHIACTGLADPDIVSYLLSKKADVNALDYNDDTPLMHCIECKNSTNKVAILELLIQAGANVNKGNRCMISPLQIAKEIGDEKVITLLLQNKANENHCEYY